MRNLILFILLFEFSSVIGQEDRWLATKIDTLQIQADTFIGNDSFSGYYFITNNIFIKKTKTKTWQYKNLSLGKISKIDIQNPLNIVVFYDTFNTVVLLDNQLNETQKINLSEISTPILATATGLAFGNRLWIYNSLSQQIGLFDFLKNEYNGITTSFKGNIKHYSSDYNSFQWIDANQNWNTCNIYGKITTLGRIPDTDYVQIISNTELLYERGKKIFYYDLNENKTTLIDFDKKTFKNFYYKDQILTIFTNEGITNYKITIP